MTQRPHARPPLCVPDWHGLCNCCLWSFKTSIWHVLDECAKPGYDSAMMSSGQPAADVPQSVSRRESTFALIRADLRRAKTLLAVGRPERMTARDVLSLYWHHPQIGAVTLYR